MSRWFTVVPGLTRRSVWGGGVIAVALMVPLIFPAYHLEDSARVVDFATLHLGWFARREPPTYVPCWPIILAAQAAILLGAGLVLAWAARRSRRATAATSP